MRLILLTPILPILLLSLWLNDYLKPTPPNQLQTLLAELYDLNQQPINTQKQLVFFVGFTNCTDECPTALNDLGQLINNNPQYAQNFEFYFMTNDLKADTAQKMQEYLAHFNPAIHGIIPTQEKINQFAQFFQMPIEPKKHQLVFIYMDTKADKWQKTPSNSHSLEFIQTPFDKWGKN